MSNENKPAAAQEAVAWMTHHDEPLLYPTFAEAAAYCDDDEPPIPLYAAPVAAAQAIPNGKLVGWWNGITPDITERSPYGPSVRWGANAEDRAHDIPLYDGYNPVHYQQPTPAAPGIDLEPFRLLVEGCEAEFTGAETEELEPDDSKVSYPEDRCNITFGMIRNARKALDASPKGGSDAQSWKLLESGEIIARGDQLLESDCTTWGELVGWEVGLPYNPAFHVPMRRSQATSAEVGA